MSSTRGSWNGNPNGNWWGLVQKKGPWNETADDRQRAKDRGGYPHAGHANWYDRINPGPYIQTKRPSKPFYTPDKDTVLQKDRNFPSKSRVGSSSVPNRNIYDRSIQSIIGGLGVKKISPLPIDNMGEPSFTPADLPKSIISETLPKRDARRDSTLYSAENPHHKQKTSPLTVAFEHPIVEIPQLSAVRPFSAPSSPISSISPSSAVSNEMVGLNADMRNLGVDVLGVDDSNNVPVPSIVVPTEERNYEVPYAESTLLNENALRHTDKVDANTPLRSEFNTSSVATHHSKMENSKMDFDSYESNPVSKREANSPLEHPIKKVR